MVNVTYHMNGSKRVSEKIKLMDVTGTKTQKVFSGVITKAKGKAFVVNNVVITYDEFTLRVGQKVRRGNARKWKGAEVAVVAVLRNDGNWHAEAIRESLTIAATN